MLRHEFWIINLKHANITVANTPSMRPLAYVQTTKNHCCELFRFNEVRLHLAYRWFCKLDLDDRMPHDLTSSENRLGRFRESDVLRIVFECVVSACMAHGLVKA